MAAAVTLAAVSERNVGQRTVPGAATRLRRAVARGRVIARLSERACMDSGSQPGIAG